MAKWLHVKGRFLLFQWAECSKGTCTHLPVCSFHQQVCRQLGCRGAEWAVFGSRHVWIFVLDYEPVRLHLRYFPFFSSSLDPNGNRSRISSRIWPVPVVFLLFWVFLNWSLKHEQMTQGHYFHLVTTYIFYYFRGSYEWPKKQVLVQPDSKNIPMLLYKNVNLHDKTLLFHVQ